MHVSRLSAIKGKGREKTMKSRELCDIIRDWRREANIKTPVLYKTMCVRGASIDRLYITTDQPMKMESLILKYEVRIAKSEIFHKDVEINIVKADCCVF